MNHQRSQAAFEEAQTLMPGGVNSPVRAFKSVHSTPLFIERGEGAFLFDIDGNEYVDFVQSWGPLIFGHRNERIEEAIITAVKHGVSFGAPTQAESDLAALIISIYKSIDQIRFVNSGTEAVMSAIRVARGVTQRDDIIKFEGCYHGHSDSLLVQAGSGAVTFGHPSSPGVPQDVTKHTLLATYNDIASVERCFKQSSSIAAVIIEPIAGNMGLVPADKEFLQALRTLCDQYGTLLIFDEVMSGFRSGLYGAESQVGVEPDLITLGKVIGAGMPVGAFGGKQKFMQQLSPVGPIYQAGTLSGNPVAMAAGYAALSHLKENSIVYNLLEARAKRLMQGFEEAASKAGVAIKTAVRGSMFGFFFNANDVKNFDDAQQSNSEQFATFHKAMIEQGFYFACSQYETGFINTAITDEMIELTIKAAHIAMREL